MRPTEFSPIVRLEICNGGSALASGTALHAPYISRHLLWLNGDRESGGFSSAISILPGRCRRRFFSAGRDQGLTLPWGSLNLPIGSPLNPVAWGAIAVTGVLGSDAGLRYARDPIG